VILESLFIPEPVISVAVEPKTKQDMDKLSKALQSLSEEDPTFRVNVDLKLANRNRGMGELPEILVDRCYENSKVEANVGAHKSLTGDRSCKRRAEGKFIRRVVVGSIRSRS